MSRGLVLFLVACLLAQTLAVPAGGRPGNRLQRAGDSDMNNSPSTSSTSSYDVDDDDDELEAMQTSPSEGSNVMSLLNLASALLPSASGSSGLSSVSGSSDRNESHSPLWNFKLDIIRALLQFGTSILGSASAAFTKAVIF